MCQGASITACAEALMEAQAHTEQSDKSIAEHVGVSHEMVRQLRGQLSTVDTSNKPAIRTGLDGVQYPPPSFSTPALDIVVFFGGEFFARPFCSPFHSRWPFARFSWGLAIHSPLAYGCCGPPPFSFSAGGIFLHPLHRAGSYRTHAICRFASWGGV